MLSALVLLSLSLLAPTASDPLMAGFVNPPASARPHTWWHWMDGNVTKEGITADLEAMKEVGIGGAQMFTVAQGIPKGPVDYMSPLWREMTVHAVREADRLGIELCIHNCAGWSSSGGPWVKPEDAMQTLAWSSVAVNGPKHIDQELPPIKAPQVFVDIDYRRDIAVYAVQNDAVQDVTANFSNGRLTWDVPPGDWQILRMGHVPTGKDNHPAPKEGDGLEVDKMSRSALKRFWDNGTMAAVLKDIGGLAGKTLNNALVDSYEVGNQNWTPLMREEFKKRRGYDPMPWLPAVAGVTVESREKSDRFLWDLNRTIADLFADNYFGYFAELCHENGLQFSNEPYDGPFDNLQVGSAADIPMGEFWIGGYDTLRTTKLAASVGHVNGRPIIGAESFTADDVRGRWLEEPYAAKTLGDLVFCNGVNRYIFHRYAHQPWMDKFPGMTMGPWGTHLERTQTWWTEARAWMKYIARCQFLLQQGQFVADVLYFTGEGAPNDLPVRQIMKPTVPAGYDYDGCDTAALRRLKVKGGRLVLPSGMSYRMLVLPEKDTMTPETAQTVLDLVRAGALVVGPAPALSPSLTNYPDCDVKLAQIRSHLWGGGTLPKSGSRQVGAGKIVWGKPLEDVLKGIRLAPDLSYVSESYGSKLAYIHRRINDADVYFVSNQQYKSADVNVNFRVAGKEPELWHPDTGKTELSPAYFADKAHTTVQLKLDPAESVFVVFRKPSQQIHVVRVIDRAARVKKVALPRIEIIEARYEAPDGRGADVTSAVSQLVKEGSYEIGATNANFGDPVVNVVKRLRVTYTINGKKQTQTVAENDSIALLQLPRTPIEPKSYEITRTGLKTAMTGWKKADYVVHLSDARAKTVSLPAPIRIPVAGDWTLEFAPGWGAPEKATFKKLQSWTESKNERVKYFSGSAVYSKSFVLSQDATAKGRRLRLDLGRVKNFATVTLNGKDLGVLWKEPFILDVTGVARKGKNELKVKVTNLWPNRIIGDEQLEADVEWNGVQLKEWPEWLVKGQPRPSKRYTFTTWRFWNRDSELLESGLIGPVTVLSAKPVIVQD